MENKTILNEPFDYEFAGKVYQVKRASVRQAILFQERVKVLTDTKDASTDLRMGAYAIFLALNAVDKNVTEDFVLDNAPGDIDVMETIATLGFMSQQKVEAMRRIQNALAKVNNGGESSAS